MLQPPVLPEPPRSGEGDRDCECCADVERDVVWSDERWVLTGAGPLGLPFGALLMPHVGRVHVSAETSHP